ncbi:MAG: T9SS type A sorting domain-containing protein [Candidatus Kapaibacterium sp.]
MKPFFLSFLLLSCVVIAADGQPQNESVSSGTIFDGEPYLAVNPTNQDNMVIAWMSYDINAGGTLLERFGIRLRSSFDGGKTWGNEVVMPHYVKTYHSADVSMAFHKDGTLYIEYIDYRTSPDSGVIVVSHSSDGGKSWSTPIKAFDGYDNNDKPIDRPWIVVDNSGRASDGTIYITTKPVFWDPLPNHSYMKYSADGGISWSTIAAIDGGGYGSDLIQQPMASPAVSSDGIFHAAYVSWQKITDPARIVLASSSDHGANFTHSVIYLPQAGAGKDTLSKLGYRLAGNPLDAKNMIFTAIDSHLGDNDVFSAVTIDGGASWTAPIRINDDPVGNGVWQDLVWANYSDNGKCVISWRDRRNGDSSGYEKGSDIYFSVSTDGGKSFGKNVKLSDQTAAFNKVLNGSGNDFHCTSIVHDSICAVWGDTRSGKLTIYFAKAALSDGIAKVIQVSQGKSNFLLYPNPASHSVSLRFTLDKPDLTDLFIYDLTGKEIWHDGANKTNTVTQTVDLSGFSDGVYTVVAKTSKEIFSRRLTVIR